MLSFPTHGHCQAATSLVQGRFARLAEQEKGRVRTFSAGSQIYGVGGATDHLYVVVSGRVRTSVLSPEGRELVLSLPGPGEVFGEFCFCAIRARQEQAVAVTDTTVARLDLTHLTSLLQSSESEALGLLELFCHRMADMQDRLTELAFANVRTRLGLFLLRMAEGGAKRPEGGLRCRESLTHEEMAARIITTREQVSTILTQFRDQRLIDYRRGGPLVVFPDRLSRYLEGA